MRKKLVQEFGSEFDWESNNEFKNDNLKYSYFNGMECFRSGRDALKAIAVRYKDQYKRVLLPALCCESMVTPFEMNGYEISYFKITSNIVADFTDILSKFEPYTIFLYMNYFGFPSLSDEELNTLKYHFQKTIIIEDRTHDILMKRNREFNPDYTVFSIRKWLAVPDGGVLYSHCWDKNFPKEEDPYFGDIRVDALIKKSEYLISGSTQLKRMFRSKFDAANNYLDKSKVIVGMSPKSYKLLQNIDFLKISQTRKENTLVFSQQLRKINGVKSILYDTSQSSLYFPILVENRDKIQSELAEKNIYCPVIWPLPERAKGICEVSDYISSNMLALPCDQRYRKSDIEHICNVLGQILGNE